MKKVFKELDVDFIGGLGELTKDEEKELSLYFLSRKTTFERLKTKRSGRVQKPKKEII
jgi:hypothetical protein